MRIREIKGKLEGRENGLWNIKGSWRKRGEKEKPEKRGKGRRS